MDRDRFVAVRRGARAPHDPWRHQGVLIEDERARDGTIARVATVFLTGRECSWRCAMCDLWQHAIADDTPRGALVRQLDDALKEVADRDERPTHVKLYNASNFFDPRAVPESDYDQLAERLIRFQHVIVESHPALVGRRLERFVESLTRAAGRSAAPTLEVAMGLETANADALDRLNKGFTLQQFASAAERLHRRGSDLRAFVLVGVPFVAADAQQEWVERSVSFAFECGATAVSLIPLRSGNGTLEALHVPTPTLADIELAFDRALPSSKGRVFVDVWNLERLTGCRRCFSGRRERLRLMNLNQQRRPAIVCDRCGASSDHAA